MASNPFTKILHQLMTGKDNETHDIARWSWMVTTITVIGLACWNAYHSTNFILRDFAESIGIIAAAHGGAILMKKDTEPTEPTEPQ